MATATKTASVTFDEPTAVKRVKRPWYELYPAAAGYVDGILNSFADMAKGQDKEFARKVTGISIPLDRDSENPDMRAVRLLNERARSQKIAVHATMRGGQIHLVNAAKVVRKRNRKPAAE
jgi:hypothetical protein